MSTPPPLVEMRGITKLFPGSKALSGVDFRLERGEVHVLFGENGAGKSTLISILAGVLRPTEGTIRIEGRPVAFLSGLDAVSAGIGTVFQEFSLVPTLRVFENLYLGRELRRGWLLDRRAMLTRATVLFRELGFAVDAGQYVSRLSRAEQQMVEIAKAFLSGARILILDEPTASLSEKETRALFAFIGRARARGVGIVYISHRIQEFAGIADRISVLRDGHLIGTVAAKDATEATLVELMSGRAMDRVYPVIERLETGKTVLSLDNIRTAGVAGASVEVRSGEVLGVAGLVGSGKSRFWRAMLGLQPVTGGCVKLMGRDVTRASTARLLRSGIFYLPADRKAEGLHLAAAARDNIGLALLDADDVKRPFAFISPRRKEERARAISTRIQLPHRYLSRRVAALSGGNQQKVLFGKGLGRDHQIYIFDEPTVGVDVRTRAELYLLVKELAEAGKAVVVISSDLPEVMHLSHRLIVFAKGRIAAELTGDAVTEENILRHFFSEARIPA